MYAAKKNMLQVLKKLVTCCLTFKSLIYIIANINSNMTTQMSPTEQYDIVVTCQKITKSLPSLELY